MKLNIEELRNKIDYIDKKIFNLIYKRFKIVEKIGILKIKNKVPFYIPNRENEIISIRIQENKNKKISEKFTKSLLKKIMYESYYKEINIVKKYRNVNNINIKIVFIGGSGNMGSLFKRFFILYNYKILELNSKDWDYAESILKDSSVIIICSPISKLNEILNKLKKLISKECILLDISSTKEFSVNKMLSIHSGPVLGLHPMFGPNSFNLTKQIMIYCDGRYPEKYKWLLNQFKLWGMIIYNSDIKEHDKYMSYVQSLRYFNYLTMGSFFMKKKINLNKLINLSPPINNIHLSNIGNFFSGNIDLYLEIIFSLKNNILIINNYLSHIKNIFKYIKTKNKEKISNLFKKTKSWINNNNLNYLSEINNLLSEEFLLNK